MLADALHQQNYFPLFVFFLSPLSPCPGADTVLAVRFISWLSERLTSSLSLILPFSSRLMYRLSPFGSINSRLAELFDAFAMAENFTDLMD
jgi:hypothetical protein